VLDRHEAYVAAEVARVLAPGGTFWTQQVDGRDLAETVALFDGTLQYPDVTLTRFRTHAERAGLLVDDAREWVGAMVFAGVATLVS